MTAGCVVFFWANSFEIWQNTTFHIFERMNYSKPHTWHVQARLGFPCKLDLSDLVPQGFRTKVDHLRGWYFFRRTSRGPLVGGEGANLRFSIASAATETLQGLLRLLEDESADWAATQPAHSMF